MVSDRRFTTTEASFVLRDQIISPTVLTKLYTISDDESFILVQIRVL